MELIMDNSYTRVIFTQGEIDSGLKKIVEDKFHTDLGVKEEGYAFNPAFRAGYYDGIVDFYEKKEQRFPTGLTDIVEEILGKLQGEYDFTYTLVDDRPDAFVPLDELPDKVTLLDDEVGEITLRDYQYCLLYTSPSPRD